MNSSNNEQLPNQKQNTIILAQAIVFFALTILAGVVLAVVSFGGVDWFYPTILLVVATLAGSKKFF